MDLWKAESTLRSLIEDCSPAPPHPLEAADAWKIFRNFAALPVTIRTLRWIGPRRPVASAFLFECGKTDSSHDERFRFGFTRALDHSPRRPDQHVRLHLELTREPSVATDPFETSIRSSDFDSIPEFFEAVERFRGFQRCLTLDRWEWKLWKDRGSGRDVASE